MQKGVGEDSQARRDLKEILHIFNLLGRFGELCNPDICFFKGLDKTKGKVSAGRDFDEPP